MKTLVLVGLTFLLCTLVKAQDCCKPYSITVGLESGYSFNHSAIAGFNAGVNFKDFNFRVGMDAHLTDRVKDGILLRSQMGYTYNINERFYVNPAIGYGYSYKSADDKSLNSSHVIYNLEFGYKYYFKDEPLSVYLSGMRLGTYTIAAVGIRSYF